MTGDERKNEESRERRFFNRGHGQGALESNNGLQHSLHSLPDSFHSHNTFLIRVQLCPSAVPYSFLKRGGKWGTLLQFPIKRCVHGLFDKAGGERFGGLVEALYGGFERVGRAGRKGGADGGGGGFDFLALAG